MKIRLLLVFLLGCNSANLAVPNDGGAVDSATSPAMSGTFDKIQQLAVGAGKPGFFCRVFFGQTGDHLFYTSERSADENDPAAKRQYLRTILNLDLTEKSGEFVFHEDDGKPDHSVTITESGFYILHSDDAGKAWRLANYSFEFEAKKEITIALGDNEPDNDQMVSWVNDRLDASGLLGDSNNVLGATDGASTQHRFYTPDLAFIERKTFTDVPHINGSSMIFHQEKYLFLSSTAYWGDLVLMEYDTQFNFIGSRTLINSVIVQSPSTGGIVRSFRSDTLGARRGSRNMICLWGVGGRNSPT